MAGGAPQLPLAGTEVCAHELSRVVEAATHRIVVLVVALGPGQRRRQHRKLGRVDALSVAELVGGHRGGQHEGLELRRRLEVLGLCFAAISALVDEGEGRHHLPLPLRAPRLPTSLCPRLLPLQRRRRSVPGGASVVSVVGVVMGAPEGIVVVGGASGHARHLGQAIHQVRSDLEGSLRGPLRLRGEHRADLVTDLRRAAGLPPVSEQHGGGLWAHARVDVCDHPATFALLPVELVPCEPRVRRFLACLLPRREYRHLRLRLRRRRRRHLRRRPLPHGAFESRVVRRFEALPPHLERGRGELHRVRLILGQHELAQRGGQRHGRRLALGRPEDHRGHLEDSDGGELGDRGLQLRLEAVLEVELLEESLRARAPQLRLHIAVGRPLVESLEPAERRTQRSLLLVAAFLLALHSLELVIQQVQRQLRVEGAR